MRRKGKEAEAKQSKANTSQETKKEQKSKEKIKLHVTCRESNPRPLSHSPSSISHLPHSSTSGVREGVTGRAIIVSENV
jgi:hypothetical protein